MQEFPLQKSCLCSCFAAISFPWGDVLHVLCSSDLKYAWEASKNNLFRKKKNSKKKNSKFFPAIFGPALPAAIFGPALPSAIFGPALPSPKCFFFEKHIFSKTKNVELFFFELFFLVLHCQPPFLVRHCQPPGTASRHFWSGTAIFGGGRGG